MYKKMKESRMEVMMLYQESFTRFPTIMEVENGPLGN